MCWLWMCWQWLWLWCQSVLVNRTKIGSCNCNWQHNIFDIITSDSSPQPSSSPTGQPTSPSSQPTGQPTSQPSSMPTGQPTSQPTGQPSSMPSSAPSGQPTCHPTSTPLAASFFGSGVHVAGVLFGVLLFAALSFLVYIYRAKILTYIGGGNHSVVSQSESDGRFNIDDEDNQGTYITRNVVLLLLFILFPCLTSHTSLV